MEFSEVVRKRRMVRHFTSEPVAPEVIERMLELARHAPSAGFTQGQSFVVVTRPELKQEIARLCGEEGYVEGGFHPFVSGAPVLVIPCVSEAAYHRRYQEPDKVKEDGSEIEWPVPFWYMDIGCAVMIVLLAAVNEGLAAGFAGIVSRENIEKLAYQCFLTKRDNSVSRVACRAHRELRAKRHVENMTGFLPSLKRLVEPPHSVLYPLVKNELRGRFHTFHHKFVRRYA